MVKSWMRRAAFTMFILGLSLSSCGPRNPPKPDGAKRDIVPSGRVDQALAKADIVFLVGKVSVKRQGQVIEGDIGLGLSEGDVVSTAKDSSCDIRLADLGYLRLSAQTSLVMEALELGQGRARVGDLVGTVMAKVKKLGVDDAMMIRTPTVACGVRGTVFSVSADKDGRTILSVSQGRVAVYPASLIGPAGYEPTRGQADSEINLGDFPVLGAGLEAELDGASLPPDLGRRKSEAVAFALKSRPIALDRARALLDYGAEEPLPGEDASVEDGRPMGKDSSLPGMGQGGEPALSASSEPVRLGSEANDTSHDGPGARIYGLTATAIKKPALSKLDSSWPLRQCQVRTPNAAESRMAVTSDNANYYATDGAEARVSLEDGCLHAIVEKPGPAFWSSGFCVLSDLELDGDCLYELSFDAWSSRPQDIRFEFKEGDRDNDGDGHPFSVYEGIDLGIGSAVKRYSYRFSQRAVAATKAMLYFYLCPGPGDLYLRDIRLEKVARLPKASAKDVPLANPDFGQGGDYWMLYSKMGKPTRLSFADGRLKFESEGFKKEQWDLQLFNKAGIDASKGQDLTIEFDAKAGPSSVIGLCLDEGGLDQNGNGESYQPCHDYFSVSLRDSWTHYVCRAKVNFGVRGGRMIINIGHCLGTLELDNIKLSLETP